MYVAVQMKRAIFSAGCVAIGAAVITLGSRYARSRLLRAEDDVVLDAPQARVDDLPADPLASLAAVEHAASEAAEPGTPMSIPAIPSIPAFPTPLWSNV